MSHLRIVGTLAGFLALVAGPSAQQVIVTPGVTPVVVNNGYGNQTDPHISGTLVAYTSYADGVAEIRYFDLATGVDSAIPGAPGALDFVPDVSGTTIVFTRIENAKQSVWSFETATAGPLHELMPASDSLRRFASIGYHTVAWQELGFSTETQVISEVLAYDLDTATSVRITNDTSSDRDMSVSPDGNVIAWDKCATGSSPCNIYQAVKGPGGWTVSQVTNTPDHEGFPDTNGVLVVYDRLPAGNPTSADIYWTPVAGGPETGLALAGEQRNPNIAGNLIVFQGRDIADVSLNWDIYAYDVSTQILYRLTDTLTVHETLNDVWVAGNEATVVYSARETDENVYAQTFTLLARGYDFAGTGGFQAPIANAPAVNVVNAGRVIPIKWQLRDAGGAFVTDVSVVSGLLVMPVPCGTLATDFDNAVAADTSGASGLHFDGATNQFIFNWSTTRAMAGSCYAFVLQLDDGSEYPAYFRLK